jgi:hypothetical protein
MMWNEHTTDILVFLASAENQGRYALVRNMLSIPARRKIPKSYLKNFGVIQRFTSVAHNYPAIQLARYTYLFALRRIELLKKCHDGRHWSIQPDQFEHEALFRLYAIGTALVTVYMQCGEANLRRVIGLAMQKPMVIEQSILTGYIAHAKAYKFPLTLESDRPGEGKIYSDKVYDCGPALRVWTC